MTDNREVAVDQQQGGVYLAGMHDFLTAAAVFGAGNPEVALWWLFPAELDEGQVHQRVHLLVAVGAVLTGVVAAGGPHFLENADGGAGEGPEGRVGVLATQLIDAGARLDVGCIRELIATHPCTEPCQTPAAGSTS
jgi:hypothetical protein